MTSMFPASWVRLMPQVLACAGIAACGGAGHGTPATAAAQTHAATAPGDDLVEAVGSSREQSLLDLKFALRERPQAGRPLDIDVRLTPLADLERVEARLYADDGLELRSGATLPVLDHPAAGIAVDQDIVVVPAHEGVYTILVTVTGGGGSATTVSRTFGIPLIVNSGDSSSAPVSSAAAPKS